MILNIRERVLGINLTDNLVEVKLQSEGSGKENKQFSHTKELER